MFASRRIHHCSSAISLAALFASCSVSAFATPALGTAPAPGLPVESVAAPPAPDVVERARDAFRRGAELAKADNFRGAIAAFEDSYRLKPHPVTSYNLGFCERALGHSTRARKLLNRAFAEHRAASDGPLPDDLVELAKRYLDEIDARVARVEVRLASPTAQLAVDGLPLEPDTAAAPGALPVFLGGTGEGSQEQVLAPHFVVLLDPGRHSFGFSERGVAQPAIERSLAPGSRTSLEQAAAVPLTRPLPVKPAVAVRGSATRTWAYVALGVGIAGVATGSVAGGLALGKKSTLDSACGDGHKTCPGRGDIADMNTFADLSTIGFAVGAVGLGAALGLYLWGPDPSSKSASVEGARVSHGKLGLAPNGVTFSAEF